jgi:hypothetical protein
MSYPEDVTTDDFSIQGALHNRNKQCCLTRFKRVAKPTTEPGLKTNTGADLPVSHADRVVSFGGV